MRRLLALLLAFLCACANRTEPGPAPTQGAADLTADALARAILASQPDGADYVARAAGDGEELAFYLELYGVAGDLVSNAAVYTVGGVDAREVAVLSLDHGSYAYDTASSAEALEDYRQSRYGDFYGYEPDQAALVEAGRVAAKGFWLALLICSDVPSAQEAFGAPAEPTPDPEARYKKDERGYLPFLPPNEVDMTLYDTSAIRAAYETGDERGLSKKDAAILEKCREILAACVTEGMTDFEKELALHDWLVEHMHYDRSVHDSQTPEGLPDNKDPYGGLVGGYGICLGYAASFQLLMDLAGVECITVVGASGWSREDHAWNLVKLAGEWYGVDLTWNDTTISDPTAYSAEELSRRHHKYFNITSDELRRGNRQWDYDNVPEAAGTRFHWDGVGEKPQ